MKKRILVTGGAGFIGSEFCSQSKEDILIVDKLNYSSNKKRIDQLGLRIEKIDIAYPNALDWCFNEFNPEVVIHFAAQTHVDRSIKDCAEFINTNIIGTRNLLDLSIQSRVRKFIHISTDEVYGDSEKGLFTEESPIKPNNPYSATKAAAEHLVRAYHRTYNLPAIIIRPANNYGYWQYPEKFIPVIISKALKNEKVPVYGKGKQIREWLHVKDCARGITKIMQKGKIGEVYNLGSGFEQDNLTTVRKVLQLMDKKKLIEFVPDRPGHDFRYSIDSTKVRKLGWKPEISFDEGIKHTIEWYANCY